VASNGRASITVGGFSLVAYLVNLNEIFLFVADPNVLFGFGRTPGRRFRSPTATLKGTYAGFATYPAAIRGGRLPPASSRRMVPPPTGQYHRCRGYRCPQADRSLAQRLKATYSVASSPTNGRGTMTVTSGTGGNAVIYMISASKFAGGFLLTIPIPQS